MTGLEIKIARIKAGIKAYELAQMVGINHDKMSKIENGRYVADAELLNRIKAALKLQDEVLDGEDSVVDDQATGT